MNVETADPGHLAGHTAWPAVEVTILASFFENSGADPGFGQGGDPRS